ncbi:hypothetical protein ACH5RR_013132, partial [Cinchona calisaya]
VTIRGRILLRGREMIHPKDLMVINCPQRLDIGSRNPHFKFHKVQLRDQELRTSIKLCWA